MSVHELDGDRIRELFRALDVELAEACVRGEVYLLGGAVMCLVFQARASTSDVDAYFVPSTEVNEAACRVAAKRGADAGWLNDAVKGYLSDRGTFAPHLQLEHLTISTATPEYLFAMKCLAMRLGAEFHDEADIRYLLRYLNITCYDDAVAILGDFYPLERYPQKTLHALEEILGGE